VSHSEVKLLVGLGNPGKEYERTRHNMGAMVIEEMVNRCGETLKRNQVCESSVYVKPIGQKLVFAVPRTYMNQSGRAVQRLMRFYGVSIENLLVIIDDIETPKGEARVAVNGGTRGHNGIRSIHSIVGKEFTQLRVGVGRPAQESVSDYVLSPFTNEEREDLPEVIDRSISYIQEWVEKDL